MSFGDLIDGVFRLVRANFMAVWPWLVLATLPFEALIAFGSRNGESITTILTHLGSVQDQTISSGSDQALVFGGSIGLWLVMPIVSGVVCRTVAASYLGQQLRAADAVRVGAGQVWALLVASLLGHLLELAGFCLCILPGLAFVTLLFLSAPAIVLEGLGPMAGMGRSWRLVKRRFWPVFGTALLGVLLGAVIVDLVSAVPEAAAALASSHVRAVIDAVVGTAGSALEWTIYATLATMIYFDQRIRQEGLDLELMAAQAR
jgi:hypothetical protein